MTFAQSLVAVVPKLRTPIQLAGLAFSALSAALIHKLDADNVGAISVVGAVGVAVLVIPLAFNKDLLGSFPAKHRSVFLIILLGMLLTSFGALAVVTVRVIVDLTPIGSRFDAVLDEKNVKIFRNPDGTGRVQITWQFNPQSKNVDEGATIFTGMVVLHDDEKVNDSGLAEKTSLSCSDVSSCLGWHYFRELGELPLFVRSATSGSPLTATVNIKSVPKRLRIWWEFYQREGVKSSQCMFDLSVAGPAEGMPYVGLFDKGRKTGDYCYRSFSQRIFESSKL